ncbi:MAG: hypothetical protein WA919_11615 [Coleofasciculaceae cyanobacterium]
MSNTSTNSTSPPANCQDGPSCPVNCPNRRTEARKPVLGGGYVFALIVASLLAIQSIDASYKRVNGEEDLIFATKTPSSSILVIGLTLVGLGLGIEIDKSIIHFGSQRLLKGLIHYSSSEEKAGE